MFTHAHLRSWQPHLVKSFQELSHAASQDMLSHAHVHQMQCSPLDDGLLHTPAQTACDQLKEVMIYRAALLPVNMCLRMPAPWHCIIQPLTAVELHHSALDSS